MKKKKVKVILAVADSFRSFSTAAACESATPKLLVGGQYHLSSEVLQKLAAGSAADAQSKVPHR